MIGREDILTRLKQEAYFRAVEMTGVNIDPDDVIVSCQANGTNIILPIRSRHPVWDDEGNFVEYRYEPWIWIECNRTFNAGHIVMRYPVHEATFVMFPDWMVMDGANAPPEILEAIVEKVVVGEYLWPAS